MQLQLIRNATLRFTYGGRLFLTDPFLAPKGALPPFGDDPNMRNPTVDLPAGLAAADVGANVEMAVVSHLHTDHFDDFAAATLPKGIPLYCQPGDEGALSGKGFRQVMPVQGTVTWRGIIITRTAGQHGSGAWGQRMGRVAGFVFRAAGEPTVYWAGDTIWCDDVHEALVQHQPDLIITHSSGAQLGDSGPIVMDAAQTVAVAQAAPDATVVAVHMEALDHGTVTRAGLRAHADAQGVAPGRLLIPADGETLTF